MRIRVAGIIPINNGIALMHRKNVKRNNEYMEYYVIPGGGLDEGETEEEGTKREIKEEFGINVEIVEKVYETYFGKFNQKEIYFLCKYIDGNFGTGNGPEFNNDPRYIDSGEYIPEILKFEEIDKVNLLPKYMKEEINKNMEKIKKYNKNI